MLSERLGDGDREALLARHLGMRLNKIDVYLANRGDYGGVATTPWLGTAAANDKRRFDLARWRTYERWVERMRDAGWWRTSGSSPTTPVSAACPTRTASG